MRVQVPPRAPRKLAGTISIAIFGSELVVLPFYIARTQCLLDRWFECR